PATFESSPQLSASGNSRERTNQLNREGRAGPAPVQLYRGGRTALPSEPLSRPSEGRTSAVAAVTGEDRCDPASREGESRRPVCAQVIETRSAEFRRLEPVRSAEEALMIDQRQREQAASAEAAARRLADNSGDPDSFNEQSIAAVVLIDSRNFPEAREELPAEGSTSLAEAIAAAVTGTPPPR
ncbi:MAG: hypothetical protein ACXWUN_12150, partial [Allosphingosinicella sp.]